MTHRVAARVVGALFIMATVPFSLSVVLLKPVVGAPDFLLQASLREARVAAGGKLVVGQEADWASIKRLQARCHEAGVPSVLASCPSGG